jgi:IS30 family transposase
VGSQGEHGNHRHVSAQRRKRVVELRDEGLSFRQIAAEVGIDVHTAWRHYQAACRAIPAEAIAAHAANQAKRRAEQLERIDMERESVMEVLTAFHVTVSQGRVVSLDDGGPIEDTAPVLAAIDRLVKLDDQEAKLLGLYAEQKMAVSGGVRYEVVGVNPDDLK